MIGNNKASYISSLLRGGDFFIENAVAVWYTDLKSSGVVGVSKKYSRVYVEITNICNMSCSFCHGHSRAVRRMTEEEFSLVLDKLDGVTDYVYYHLMGEPLTHPQLAEFISTASARGFKSLPQMALRSTGAVIKSFLRAYTRSVFPCTALKRAVRLILKAI